MKKKKESISPKTLQSLLDSHFEKIENRLDLMDEKNYNAQQDIAFRITSTSLDLRQRLQRDFEAQLQLLGNRLNKRITNVADLITISLTQKFETAEKRIKKLEHVQQTT